MIFIDRWARAVEASILKIEKFLAEVSAYVVLLLMFLSAADVIGRYLLSRPIHGAGTIEQIMLATLFFFGLAYIQHKRQHITIDIIHDKLPLRVQVIIAFVALLLSLSIWGFIFWSGGVQGLADWRRGNFLPGIRFPIGPFKLLVPFGAFFISLECIIQIAHILPKMRNIRGSN